MTARALPTQAELPDVQRRIVGTLMASQIFGGVGVASGIAVASVIAAEISGNDALSGLANTSQVLGGALLTIPIVSLMARRGRRIGLVISYAVGTVGAGLALIATATSSFALLLIGTFLFGASTTANSQSRFAAVDLAPPSKRGLQLSLVVWAATIGSATGPNLIGFGAGLATGFDLPKLAGPWAISGVGFLLAMVLLMASLRPDPLLTARALAEVDVPADPKASKGSVAEGIRVLRSNAPARAGAIAIAAGHIVMISIMVMTPVHMAHGGAQIEVIGFVISMHIIGMYALSPVVGYLTDRIGSGRVIMLGVAILLAACAFAGLSATGFSINLTAGLVLLGLGWSCTMVAGSAQVSAAVPVGERASAQGASDVVMGLAGASGGALAGVIVAVLGFGYLAALAAGVTLLLGAYTLRHPSHTENQVASLPIK